MGISLIVLLIVIVIGVSMSHQSAASTSATRLATVRRLYFYLVALISFIVGLVGLDGLLSSLSDAWLGTTGVAIFAGNSYLRENIASSGGLLLVAAPLFLLHWGYMQRRRHELEERSAALRKFFSLCRFGRRAGLCVNQCPRIVAWPCPIGLWSIVS
jgi:hypothetical protein